MKTTIPEKMVEVCDFCHREAYLQTCDVCSRQFCLTDNGKVTASWGFTKLCRECSTRDDVHKVCEKYAKQLSPIFKRRDVTLRHLPQNEQNGEPPK